MTPKRDLLGYHRREVTRAACAAHALLMRDPTATLHVYYRPMTLEAMPEDGIDPRLIGWELAWPERVPGHLTVEQLIVWFSTRSGRVPYLTEES